VSDDARGHGETVGLGSRVELGEQGSTLRADPAVLRVDRDGAHPRQIDDDPVVDGALAGDAVRPAPHGDLQTLGRRIPDGRRDVLRRCALGDHRRAAVDVRVPHLACFVVPVLSWLDDRTCHRVAKRGQIPRSRARHGNLSPKGCPGTGGDDHGA